MGRVWDSTEEQKKFLSIMYPGNVATPNARYTFESRIPECKSLGRVWDPTEEQKKSLSIMYPGNVATTNARYKNVVWEAPVQLGQPPELPKPCF